MIIQWRRIIGVFVCYLGVNSGIDEGLFFFNENLWYVCDKIGWRV